MTDADGIRAFAVFDESMLRTGSRADFVFETLRDAIWDGRIARGVRIREEEIARHLGVSRTPVREALQRLQQRGLLVVGAGRGLVVAELTHLQVVELYGMREILEGSAARIRSPARQRYRDRNSSSAAAGTAAGQDRCDGTGHAQSSVPSGDLPCRAQSIPDAGAGIPARLPRAPQSHDISDAEAQGIRRGASKNRSGH